MISSIAVGLLAAIFALQALADLTQSAAIRTLAFDVFGQRAERLLGWLFLLWCLAVIGLDSRGLTQLIGGAAIAAVIGAEAFSLAKAYRGRTPSGALKLAYLPVFAWLLLTSRRPLAKELPASA